MGFAFGFWKPNFFRHPLYTVCIPGVLKLYCPIVIAPGNKKYPTRLSGWVVQIISRAPSHHVARHVPRPPPTDYGGPGVIKGRIMFYSNLFNSNGLKREIVGLIP